MSRLPSRYWGPFRQEWYSYSSNPNKGGPETGFGMWTNVWWHKVTSWVYKHNYPLWFWWHNNTFYRNHSKSFKSLRKNFPNLK